MCVVCVCVCVLACSIVFGYWILLPRLFIIFYLLSFSSRASESIVNVLARLLLIPKNIGKCERTIPTHSSILDINLHWRQKEWARAGSLDHCTVYSYLFVCTLFFSSFMPPIRSFWCSIINKCSTIFQLNRCLLFIYLHFLSDCCTR